MNTSEKLAVRRLLLLGAQALADEDPTIDDARLLEILQELGVDSDFTPDTLEAIEATARSMPEIDFDAFAGGYARDALAVKDGYAQDALALKDKRRDAGARPAQWRDHNANLLRERGCMVTKVNPTRLHVERPDTVAWTVHTVDRREVNMQATRGWTIDPVAWQSMQTLAEEGRRVALAVHHEDGDPRFVVWDGLPAKAWDTGKGGRSAHYRLCRGPWELTVDDWLTKTPPRPAPKPQDAPGAATL